MEIESMTDEELQAALTELRAKRDAIVIELGVLSIELLSRQPPNQAVIYPFITGNTHEGF